ncbi:pyrroline-5-carboxylate reductase [Helicobacter valdiviensis]|uniref:Pyrroline-5-carboxylate reductase n=1 Tax=Helicobacter valdiviensis TaxID=1458358 RepID=A0A2W6MV17_9HELI|nr:pyrroline-5-carboxylate reductase [Helicobacter valdiviensis]PZT47801.1 pyrroline-5-carboxylate reductase [Helicobacter valdiviensis]
MESLLIIGYGKMAEALCMGLKEHYAISVSGRDSKKIEAFCQKFGVLPLRCKDNRIDISSKQVVLCIKPYALEAFSYEGCAKGVYSILNAVSVDTLKKKLESDGYVRAMPNVCASVSKSVTTLCGDESHKQKAIEIFSAIGKSVWIEEKNMPIAAALGGCSPAFLALVAEAMMDCGVAYGLTRVQSKEIVEGLFAGFGELLQKEHPALLKESVMSPAGSTSQGVMSLEKNALRGILQEAILASKNFA